MFHILERELKWRREQGLPEGFDVLKSSKPVIALGATVPLENQKIMHDYFRRYSFFWPNGKPYANVVQREWMAWEESTLR